MYRIIGTDQKIYGPVSAEQIRQWQSEGRIHGMTMVLADGATEWRALRTFPEFNAPPPISPYPPSSKPCNNMAVAGLTCGILCNVCCCFGWILAILGIVFSAIALNRPETCSRGNTRCMAIAGLILSIVGLSWHLFLPFLWGLSAMQPLRLYHHWRWL